MAVFVVRRLTAAIPVAFGVALGAFVIIHLVPGDPVSQMLGFHATPHEIRLVDHQLGLDKSLPAQFVSFVKGAANGNFGTSIVQHSAVGPMILSRAKVSVELIAYAIVLSLLVGVPGGILAALKRNSVFDHVLRVLTTIGLAMPAFWLGLLLALVFALKLHWFRVSGLESGFFGTLRSLTLPAVTVAFLLVPLFVRNVRAAMTDVLGQEFIDTLRANGLPERRVIVRHALRNALLSTVTLVAVSISYLISGTVVVENVFQLPGLGSLLVNSIANRDYPVVQALTLLIGIIVVLINLAADLAYGVIDPRIRLGAASR